MDQHGGGDRRARFTEVMPASKPLKRKRSAQVAIPMQIANVLPESALFLRLQLLEKRLDATLDTKVERVKGVIDRSERDMTVVCEDKVKVQLYVQIEARRKTKPEPLMGPTAADGGAGATEDFDLYIYGNVEKVAAPEPLGESRRRKPTSFADGEKSRVAGSGGAQGSASASASAAAEGGEKKQLAEGGPSSSPENPKPRSDLLELTDVLKSVSVRGWKMNSEEAIASGGKRLEEVTFNWTSAEHSGEPTNCLKTTCSNLAPGSKVQVTWEVKSQGEKFTLPQQIAPVLGVISDTKTNVITRLWKFMKLKSGPSSNEPATVEFSNQTLRRFFSEGEKGGEIKLPSVGQKLRSTLVPCRKPCIEYTIPKPGEKPQNVKSVSFVVHLPSDASTAKLTEADKLLRRVRSTRGVDQVDKDIKKIIETINERKRRRNFFLGFSQSPVNFVSSLVESQQRDLQVMKNFQTNYPTQYAQRSHIFKDAWVNDAVIRYLHQRIASQTTD